MSYRLENIEWRCRERYNPPARGFSYRIVMATAVEPSSDPVSSQRRRIRELEVMVAETIVETHDTTTIVFFSPATTGWNIRPATSSRSTPTTFPNWKDLPPSWRT